MDLNMLDAIVLTLVDGVGIVVPDSLFLITPYVLHELHLGRLRLAAVRAQ
jgi:hypothetical protein